MSRSPWRPYSPCHIARVTSRRLNLGLKSVKRTKATTSKTEVQSAARKSGGLFVREAQGDYNFLLYVV
ncbi:hypothetical protein Hanom_Chr07g00637161 [Helianthus anomalus]